MKIRSDEKIRHSLTLLSVLSLIFYQYFRVKVGEKMFDQSREGKNE